MWKFTFSWSIFFKEYMQREENLGIKKWSAYSWSFYYRMNNETRTLLCNAITKLFAKVFETFSVIDNTKHIM